jgi:hypothetical protein
MKFSFRSRIEFKDLAIFAISLDPKQDLTFRISNIPTRSFLVKISRTIYIDIFRTIQNNPAGIFIIPEIYQLLPRVGTDLILNQSLRKAIKKFALGPCRTSQEGEKIREGLCEWGMN